MFSCRFLNNLPHTVMTFGDHSNDMLTLTSVSRANTSANVVLNKRLITHPTVI